MNVFGVCENNKLIYSTNYINPLLVNAICGLVEVGHVYMEDDLCKVSVDSFSIKIKEYKGLLYFCISRSKEDDSTSFDKFIKEYTT